MTVRSNGHVAAALQNLQSWLSAGNGMHASLVRWSFDYPSKYARHLQSRKHRLSARFLEDLAVHCRRPLAEPQEGNDSESDKEDDGTFNVRIYNVLA